MGRDVSPAPSPHHQGMLYVLWQRLTRGSKDWLGVTQGAFNYLILESINWISPSKLPLPPLTMYPGLAQKAPYGTSHNLIELFHRVACIQYALLQRRDVEDAVAKLSALNGELLRLESMVPDSWMYTMKSPNTPQAAITFPSLLAIGFWNTFWMTRLGVLISLERYHVSVMRGSAMWSDLNLLVQNICSAVPYSIKDNISCALLVVRSLLVASQVSCISVERKKWIFRQLELISRTKGIGLDSTSCNSLRPFENS
jgi:hypothetical protein